jgi:thiosulfate dehydrogenase [quinone] large subunit
MPSWVLLPLRAFLGVTFIYAGLQKLADRSFFRADAPGSIVEQLHAALRTSPVHGLVATGAAHPTLFGLLIAFGELAVGLGVLLGLWTRVAASGGALIAFAFLLTVSWHTHPYYLGSDIVFLFAWTPLILAGSGDVLALDAIVRDITRREAGLPAAPIVGLPFTTVTKVCGGYEDGRCLYRSRRLCRPDACPILTTPAETPGETAEIDRRTFVRKATAAAAIGAGGLLLGGAAAVVGRLFGSSRSAAAPTPMPTMSPQRATPAAATEPPGVPIGAAESVPIGGAALFHDPHSGDLAYVVRPAAARFDAFSARCTHQGCLVRFVDGVFACPCHGAEFDATTGQVLQGPATLPLSIVPIAEGPDGRLYVS